MERRASNLAWPDGGGATDCLARRFETIVATLSIPAVLATGLRAVHHATWSGAGVQMAIALLGLGLVCARTWIRPSHRVAIGLVLLLGYGTAGLATWGLLGQGLITLVMVPVYALIFGGRRWGAVALAVCALVTTLAAVGHATAALRVHADPVSYATSWSAWVVGGITLMAVASVLVLTLDALFARWMSVAATLVEREAALAASEREKLAILNSLTDHVVYRDASLRVVWANEAFCHHVGRPQAELAGQPCVFEGTSRCEQCPVHRSLESILPESGEVTTDGRDAWSIRSYPVSSDGGTLVGVVEVARDVTEQRRAEADHRKLQAGIDRVQRLESVGVLAGGIAHDFNNLLSPILGYADLLARDFPEGSTHRARLEQIQAAAGRARDLVRQILSFCRQAEVSDTRSALQPIVKETLRFLRSSLPSSVGIQSDISSECGAVSIDPTQYHQITMNLCTNAAHAMREGGGVLTVALGEVEVDESMALRTGCRSPGRYARLTVADTGCGMDQATLARAFEPFFTTKPPGEGTGLGLSTVHGIVVGHGGGTNVYSEPGRGTTFSIYLPISEAIQEAATPVRSAIPSGDERILLVDDEPSVVTMASEMLRTLGYEVREFTDSREALRAFREAPDSFDLVITDLTMPDFSGTQIAASVHFVRPAMPVVIATGNSQQLRALEGDGVDAVPVLLKPYSVRDLACTIRDALAAKDECRGAGVAP